MSVKTKFRFTPILFLAATAILCAQQPTFVPGVIYPVGTDPQSVAIADFNRDGIPDLAVTNNNSNNISIFLGKGDGTFTAAIPASVNKPAFLEVVDLNSDGKLDIAVASGFQYYISVLFGNGDGTFQAPVILFAGKDANGIAVGDLNGDGKPDIAVTNANPTGGHLTILFNNGDGTFQPPVHLVTGNYPILLKIADVNGDGKGDLIVVDQGNQQPHKNGSMAVLLGHGDGTFDAAKLYPAGELLQGFALGDFNGDGRLDVAVANTPAGSTGSIAVLLGNGDGTFQAPRFVNGGSNPFKIAVADFNHDGKQDLVVADSNTGFYAVLTGNGDGTFQPPLLLSGPLYSTDVAAGDLNGDGKPDFVGVVFGAEKAIVFLNTTP